MAKITKCEAKRLAKNAGWDFNKDFHAQSGLGSKTDDLLAIAKLAKYRKPKSASGSTARYFFQHLEKVTGC